MAGLHPSGRAPGLLLAEGVEIPDDAELGAYVVLHEGVLLGAGCVVQDGAVLGKPPLLAQGSQAPAGPPQTVLEDVRWFGEPYRLDVLVS